MPGLAVASVGANHCLRNVIDARFVHLQGCLSDMKVPIAIDITPHRFGPFGVCSRSLDLPNPGNPNDSSVTKAWLVDHRKLRQPKREAVCEQAC